MMLPRSGIYSITNTSNGKSYIGSATDILRRCRAHRYYLKKGSHQNPHLQSAWIMYGSGSFRFDILEYCGFDDLSERECWWIELLQTRVSSQGYNVRDPLRGMTSRKGVPLSPSHRSNISAALTGKKLSTEHVAALRSSHKGHKPSRQAIESRIRNLTGVPRPPSVKEKVSESLAQSWEVISPSGQVFIVVNLKKFCMSHGLCNSNLGAVAKGRLRSYKGWTAKKL